MSSKLFILIGLFSLLIAAPEASARVGALARPLATSSTSGKTLLTRDEALALAFPNCVVERDTAFLSNDSRNRIAKLSKVEFKGKMVYPYRATRDGKWIGTAYFDTHRVRTLRETLMIVVDPGGKIGRIELLSFAEPREYIPHERWYAQFPGRKLDDNLFLKRKIRAVTGATLTSQATTGCARRVLAVHQELQRLEAIEIKRAEEQRRKKKELEGLTGSLCESR